MQGIAIVLFVAIIGVTVDQLLAARSSLIRDTEHQMARLDMVFAEQTGRAVETVDLTVRSVVDTLAAAPAGDTATFEQLLRRRIAGVRQVSDLFVANAAGEIIYKSREGLGPSLPPPGMSLLEYFRIHPEDELRISEPLLDPAGKWTAFMARRTKDASGTFSGMVLAGLNLAYFEDFYKAVELNENGAILLHRRDGTVLARYPPVADLIGKSYADLPPFSEILSKQIAGTVLMDSPLDGSRRVLAIRALKAFPLAVNVSVDEASVLHGWWRSTIYFAIAAATAGIVLAALLFMLSYRSREIERLLRAAESAREAAERANEQLVQQMQERERAEAALRQAQRMEAIGQLTGGVAHDFNNLLTVVLGNIDLLQLSEKLETRSNDLLNTMRAAAERGATLTSQLLAFARRQPLVPRDVNVNKLVADMDDLMQSALGSRITIATKLDPNLWQASVDPTQIELVILNLAINARDAMPGGGTLTIATRNAVRSSPVRPEEPMAGDYVEVTVCDTGTGMTPNVLARAFEPFFTTKGPGAGSGLGLPQVLGFATQSGGGVRVDSAVGHGTSVHVYLPRATSSSGTDASSLAPMPTEKRGSHATVLVVDDDAAVRQTVVQLLRSLGYTVCEANGGGAALEWLAERRPVDVLLTDLAMPDIAGAELSRRARELRPGLPVVFISGYAEPQLLTGDARNARLVLKPFRPQELAQQIEAAIAETASAT
ncbi:MAG TPA: response regulator [Acetobacteraceae bacterium]|nr:response regulator [Acetobacteraceae bacterium]